MSETALSSPAVVPPKGLAGRIVGVLTAPRATYADVAARPTFLGVFVAVLVLTIAPLTAFLLSEVGQRALLDQQVQVLESFGRPVSDELYQQLERRAPVMPYVTAAGQIVGLPVVTLVVAGLAYSVLSGAFGGSASFRQVYSVVAYSSVLTALRTLFSAPLNYARETLSSPTNLAAVLPFFDDASFLGRLFGSIDLFLIWWTVNLAIGLGVLYRRRTSPIAMTMLVVYTLIALSIAAVRTMLAGA